MKFREIVDSPCGIRYLFDALGLQSGYARKVLLDREIMIDSDQIDAAYARLRTYFNLVVSDRRRVEDMRFRLQGLRDISGTLSALAEGATLDEIEFFEIKHMAMLAESLAMGKELDTVIGKVQFNARHYSVQPLAEGQWVVGGNGDWTREIISAGSVEGLAVTSKLQPLR